MTCSILRFLQLWSNGLSQNWPSHFIAGSTIALYVLNRKFIPSWWVSSFFERRFSHSWSGPEDVIQSLAETRSVELRQVAPPVESQTATKIDIIAIHGFDTKSPDTWIWDPRGAKVNWLEVSRILPTLVDARIYRYICRPRLAQSIRSSAITQSCIILEYKVRTYLDLSPDVHHFLGDDEGWKIQCIASDELKFWNT